MIFPRWIAREWRGFKIFPYYSAYRYRGCTNAGSTRTFELARRVTGNIVTAHAGFANIDALTELPCIKIFVSLGDANTLLIRVFGLLRTGRKIGRYCHQKNEASQLHGAVSDRGQW